MEKLRFGQSKITLEDLKNSCLFDTFHNIKTDNCFSGKGQNTNFSVEELSFYSYVPWKGKRKQNILFTGIVIKIDMNRTFSGYQSIG